MGAVAETCVVRLRFEPGGAAEPIAGQLVDANGETRRFTTWVALIEALQQVRTNGHLTSISHSDDMDSQDCTPDTERDPDAHTSPE